MTQFGLRRPSFSNCTATCVNRNMMEVCGDAENRLATELMQHELQIEKDVLDPLSQLAEVRLTLRT